ncbi:hypothetical protein N0V94_006156 [Neodidymelliopsis sp. IMI 364377]|nr:hypothetical protein N0V94_006156 [Neodidymelliopsis sp. IMI 364377]
MDFIMKYLDFVFPALFPFYQNNVYETGRSWLLSLLNKSRIAYHATLGLSCYYFTTVLTDIETGPEHAHCKQVRWEEVEQQTEQCFASLREEIAAQDLNQRTTTSTLEKVELLENIMQVLIFETAVGRSAPWNSHLPPAYTLFKEIMATSGSEMSSQNQSQSKLVSTLLGIGHPLWINPGPDNYIWSPDQTGFRFCAGLLIFIDILASTALQASPKLSQYHPKILKQPDAGTPNIGDAQIQLSGIVGCSNWVVLSIAEISALNVWKREHVEASNLSDVELNSRAQTIATKLKSNIIATQMQATASTSSTLIWAYAAQLYLTVTVEGWHSRNPAIRVNVTQAIALLQTIPSHQMRALAWPLCVAGCLASESQEYQFSTLLSTLGKGHTAGALDDTQQIMEKVWEIRLTLDASTWDLASCFAILGSPILLF